MRKKNHFVKFSFAALFTLGCVLFAAFSFSSANAEEVKKEALIVTPGTLAAYVDFEGRALSGMTVDEALKVIEAPVEKIKDTRFFLRSPEVDEHIYEVSPSQIGISWDLNNIQETLLQCELNGSLLERYKKAKDVQASPVSISINLSVDKKQALDLFEPFKEYWRQEPCNASISMKSGEKIITPSEDGLEYDFEEGVEQMEKDVLSGNLGDSGRYMINATVNVKKPALTTEQVSGFTIIGSYVTNYNPPSTEILANRENNLILACKNMDGSMFAPGEEISALTMYGPVTEEAGFKHAGTYKAGMHVDETGGGICQVTTTLYNAGLYAELEIVLRNQHSMYVDYVTPSRDAMVYALGGRDFKMRNNTSDYIVIESWVDPATLSLHIIIVGHEDHDPDHHVEFESEVLEVTTPDLMQPVDSTLPVGVEMMDRSVKYNVIETGYPGLRSNLWKLTYDGDELISRTLLNSGDTYKPGAAEVHRSADMFVTLQSVWNPEAGKVQNNFNFFYLNNYPLSVNLATLSDAEVYNFHREMARLMNQYGGHWPGYSEPTTTTEPTSRATTKAPTTKATTTAEPTTTTTEAPTTTTTAEPETTESTEAERPTEKDAPADADEDAED